jgi:nucleotide-binding universal stress UspA family protein
MSGETPSSDLSIREPPRILVPIEVLEGQIIPESLVEFLAPSTVIVLGYHVIPEQTPAEQASMQFEERAETAVADIAANFKAVGRTVETRVAFTHDREQTIERVASDVGATAVLLPNPVGSVSDVLVPIRGVVDEQRLADLVATLLADTDGTVTLWALRAGAETGEIRDRMDRAADLLRDRGLPPERIRTEESVVDAPIRAIVDRSGEFDVIVMGEGKQTVLASILGDASDRVADGAVAPVLVVRDRTV